MFKSKNMNIVLLPCLIYSIDISVAD